MRTEIWHLKEPGMMDIHLCTRHLGEMRFARPNDHDVWEPNDGRCWACLIPGWSELPS